jgi:hypothetical protein
MQRRILETLDEAKAAMPSYRGATMGWTVSPYGQVKPADYDWTLLGAYVVVLAPGVYDLRCSAAYLARTLDQDGDAGRGGRVAPSFKAGFARATRGLVARGLLAQLREVPVTEVIHPRRSQPTSVFWYSRQLRFVTLSANPVGLTLRGNQRGKDGRYPE